MHASPGAESDGHLDLSMLTRVQMRKTEIFFTCSCLHCTGSSPSWFLATMDWCRARRQRILVRRLLIRRGACKFRVGLQLFLYFMVHGSKVATQFHRSRPLPLRNHVVFPRACRMWSFFEAKEVSPSSLDTIAVRWFGISPSEQFRQESFTFGLYG